MAISASALARRASERFMLVRLTPARYVVDDLVSQGGGVYGLTWTTAPVAKVERNGVVLAKTTGTPGSNDTWSYDETTKAFKIKLASAPSLTNVIIVYYYLFYTGHRSRDAYETPTDNTTPNREWLPRIAEYPSLRQSFSNVLAGTFTVENSSLTLINADQAFEAFLGPNDSFSNKNVEIWLCVDSTSDMALAFVGKVNSLQLSQGQVTLDFYDAFSLLGQSAFMGDSSNEAYFSRSASSFPNLYPPDQYKPCPLILGKSSPYSYDSGVEKATGIGLIPGLQAVCTNFSDDQTLLGTTNRTWGLCRVPSTGLRTPVVPGSRTSVSASGSGGFITANWSVANYASADIKIGDSMTVTQGAWTAYGQVQAIVNNGISVAVTIPFANPTAAFGGFDNTCVITPHPAIYITVENNGTTYYPVYGYDYTHTLTTTSGGNKYLKIDFVTFFEDHYGMGTAGNYMGPSTHIVKYQVDLVTTNLNHADVLSSLCAAAGLTVDSTSFAAAKVALPVNTAFMIPTMDETEYGTYRDYAEKILASTLGYVRINTAQAVEYYLLSTPNSTASVDNNIFLAKSFNVSIDYNDVTTEIVASNMHYGNKAALDSGTSPAVTLGSAKAQYLHGGIKSVKFEHVLESISARLPYILLLREARRVIYSFQSATEHMNTALGDDLQLDTNFVLGTTKSQDVKVTSIDRGAKSVTIEALDLKDL